MQKITSELKFTSGGFLEFAVLRILENKKYFLSEIVEELSARGMKTPMGSLYPLMSALRKSKCLSTFREESDHATELTSYGISEIGRKRLRALRRDWGRLNDFFASL